MLCVHVHIQGNTPPYGQECLLFLMSLLVWIWTYSLWQHSLTSHMFWNPVASLTPISSSLSLSPSLLISHLSPFLRLFFHHPTHPQRGVYAGPRGRRRLARHRTSVRGSNIRLDLWSKSTNTRCPWRTVSQHASTYDGTHFYFNTLISLSPPVTLRLFTFKFFRSCLFPSVHWCLRRWHLLLLLLLAPWATWRSPITSLPFTARALRWPITEWLLSCGPTP